MEGIRRKRRNRLLVCLAVFLALAALFFFLAEPALRRLLPGEAEPLTETIPVTMEDEAKL